MSKYTQQYGPFRMLRGPAHWPDKTKPEPWMLMWQRIPIGFGATPMEALQKAISISKLLGRIDHQMIPPADLLLRMAGYEY